MKKFLVIFTFIALIVAPSLGSAQNSFAKGIEAGNTLSGVNLIPQGTLMQVLSMAAPHFGYAPEDFIRLYQNCSCVTVTQVGPGTYYVTYGGIGILIVIDGCRTGNCEDAPRPGGRK